MVFPVFGVSLMHIEINIQGCDGKEYKIFVVPHYLEVSVNHFAPVNLFVSGLSL
jgi:hypothetical protein